jgi:transcriptional regulator with XRE-family HTH domain
MSFGQRLKEIKKTFRLNQDEFSEILGVSKTSINNYYNEENLPSIDVISKLLIKFDNINSEWLINGKGQMLKNGTDIDIKTQGDKNQYKNIGSTIEVNEGQEKYKTILEAKNAEILALKKIISLQEKEIERLTKT